MDKHLRDKLEGDFFDLGGEEYDPSAVLLRAKRALESMEGQYSKLLSSGRDVSSLHEKIGAMASLYNMARCLVADRVTIGLYMRLHESEILESREIKEEWKRKNIEKLFGKTSKGSPTTK